MLGSVYNILGVVSVEENVNNNTILVKGINGFHLDYDISKQWNTSKIYAHIMRKSTRFGFEIDNFFAVDLLYIIRKIVTEGKRIRGSRRQYQQLIESLVKNTWLRGIEQEYTPSLNYSALGRLTVSLFEHQERFLRTYDQNTANYKLSGYLLGAAPGSGKALRNDTKVKVPGGWRCIGDLHVGDLVASPDGVYTRVTGVFPQGKVDLYNVEFADGRVVPACGEHLWKYHDHNADKEMWQVKNTKHLMERLDKPGNRIYVPLLKAVDDVQVGTPVDRYTAASIATKASNGANHSSMQNYALARDNGLLFEKRTEVELPRVYLQGAPLQRRYTLMGIMDNAATVSDAGLVTVRLNSKPLALQTQELLWSIGAIAKLEEKDGHWIIRVRHRCLSSLFRADDIRTRVSALCREEPDLMLGVKSITPIKAAKATCISVESEERLFITKDYIVTHNTITGIALSECLDTNTTICIVPRNSVINVWQATLASVFKEPVKYWTSLTGDSENEGASKDIPVGHRYYVFHYEQLDVALEFVRKNKAAIGKVNILLDESHNFNDLKSARTQMFCDLVKESRSISSLFASGTPVKAMGSEVIPIMRCIDRFFTSQVEERFKKVFGLSTSRALDILANRMGLITFKVDKANVVGNVVNYYDLDVKMPTADNYTLDKIKVVMADFITERMKWYQKNMQKFLDDYREGLRIFQNTLKTKSELEEFAYYNRCAKQLNAGYDPRIHAEQAIFCNKYEKNVIIPRLPSGIKESFREAKSVYKYYNLKVQGEALGRILGRLRTQCSVEMAQAMDNYVLRPNKGAIESGPITLEEIINQGASKTVIFTSYVEVVDTLYNALSEKGFQPLRVYAETNKNLAAMIKDFDKNPDINPCIATYPSLSTAVPLVMANQGVMHNAPFRIHEYEQAVSRMDRIGQKEEVNIFNLYLDTGKAVNISTRSVDIMAWSKAQVDAIMGTGGGDIALESIVEDYVDSMTADEINLIAEVALESCDTAIDVYYVNSYRVRALEKVLGW